MREFFFNFSASSALILKFLFSGLREFLPENMRIFFKLETRKSNFQKNKIKKKKKKKKNSERFFLFSEHGKFPLERF